MKRFLFTYIFFVIAVTASAQDLDQEGFIKALAGEDDIRQYVSEDELQSSERLGITYYDEKEKFLIGYGLPEEIQSIIKAGRENYELSYPMTGNGYGALTLSVPSVNFKKIFYFKNDKYISPLTFHTRNYTKNESDFFRFCIDDTTYFNEYSMKQLDAFVDEMLSKMKFTALEREILINEKFNYVLCKDAEEIKLVTGYDTRGMYVKAYDAVVTTFNTHYHEVAHGVMYFKQKTDIKPELLFFQEGFAVGTGGRGGESFWANLHLGRFLIKSNMIDLNDIINNDGFESVGSSISYNTAGICNIFILFHYGFDRYMELYEKYSASKQELHKLSFSDMDIFNSDFFSSYIQDMPYLIMLKGDAENIENMKDIISTDDVKISGNNDYYKFKVKESILLSESEPLSNYMSHKFKEKLPDREYKGEKYYISVDNDEISLYNLYTNELIEFYSKGFSIDNESIEKKEGYYEFYIMTGLFDESLGDLTISK